MISSLLTGAWTPKIQNANEWLQIDLGKQYIITKLHSQGRRGSDEYVMEFFLEFSDDGTTWKRYTNRYGIAEVIKINLLSFILLLLVCLIVFGNRLQCGSECRALIDLTNRIAEWNMRDDLAVIFSLSFLRQIHPNGAWDVHQFYVVFSFYGKLVTKC